jgi:hypothetical protein
MSVLQTPPRALGSCVHCGETNTVGAMFCTSCGKALPVAGATPRIVQASEFADTHVGQSVQAEALAKQTGLASKALLAVAVIQTVLGGVLAAMMMPETGPVVAVVVGAIAAAFYGLYFWSRRNPLPAAVCGLVLYITLLGLDAVADPAAIARGWLIKIIIISVLAKAISAGIKHRELVRHMNENGSN